MVVPRDHKTDALGFFLWGVEGCGFGATFLEVLSSAMLG